jgi:hypothetical protein
MKQIQNPIILFNRPKNPSFHAVLCTQIDEELMCIKIQVREMQPNLQTYHIKFINNIVSAIC